MQPNSNRLGGMSRIVHSAGMLLFHIKYKLCLSIAIITTICFLCALYIDTLHEHYGEPIEFALC